MVPSASGARGGGRTHTRFPSEVFETSASAIPPLGRALRICELYQMWRRGPGAYEVAAKSGPVDSAPRRRAGHLPRSGSLSLFLKIAAWQLGKHRESLRESDILRAGFHCRAMESHSPAMESRCRATKSRCGFVQNVFPSLCLKARYHKRISFFSAFWKALRSPHGQRGTSGAYARFSLARAHATHPKPHP